MKEYEFDNEVALMFDDVADHVHNVADATRVEPRLLTQTTALYELADQLRSSAITMREVAAQRETKGWQRGFGYSMLIYIHFAIYVLAGWKLVNIVTGRFG